MRAARAGHLLLTLGLLVGAAAGGGLLVGFEPARLPPALLDIVAYKLTFGAALGLFAAGAMFLRHARRRGTQGTTSAHGRETPGLAEGRSGDLAPDRDRQAEGARRTSGPP